jgi:hypothetical protein
MAFNMDVLYLVRTILGFMSKSNGNKYLSFFIYGASTNSSASEVMFLSDRLLKIACIAVELADESPNTFAKRALLYYNIGFYKEFSIGNLVLFYFSIKIGSRYKKKF